MKLFRLKISGTPIDDVTAYTPAQINGNISYVYADVNPSAPDYDELTDIVDIDEHGVKTGKDYKYHRDVLKSKLTTWGSHTAAEKTIFCNHKIGTQVERNSHVGEANAKLMGLNYAFKAGEARKVRLGYGITEIHSELPDDSGAIIDASRDAVVDYVFFGREGTVQGDSEGITDYLNSLGGYTSTGLSVQSYTPINCTLAELIDTVEDIILNGNY